MVIQWLSRCQFVWLCFLLKNWFLQLTSFSIDQHDYIGCWEVGGVLIDAICTERYWVSEFSQPFSVFSGRANQCTTQRECSSYPNLLNQYVVEFAGCDVIWSLRSLPRWDIHIDWNCTTSPPQTKWKLTRWSFGFQKASDRKHLIHQFIATFDGSEIPNNHLGSIKSCKQRHSNYQPQLVNAGFRPSTACQTSQGVGWISPTFLHAIEPLSNLNANPNNVKSCRQDWRYTIQNARM